MAKLGDVCRVIVDGDWIESKDQSENGIRLIQTGNIGIGEYLDKSNRAKYITPETFERLKCTEVLPGDILISRLPDPIGRACIVPKTVGKAITAVDCTVVRLETSLCDTNYFVNYTQSIRYSNELSKFLAGTTRTRISRKNLEKIEIPLPSIERQRKIAAQLDKVSDLIAKRRAQLDKLDLLVKARFVEMFGDVETNPMNWPTSTIGAVVDSIEAGWSGNGTQREKQPGEIAVLKVSAVTKGYFIPSECKVLDDQENIKKYVFPQKGDLLFSRANTREMVGATAVISEDYPELILPDKLWKIRFIDGINVHYMKQVLSSKSVREKFSAASTGTSGSMYNVSMDKFKQIKIPVPPADSQDNFSQFVEQTERMKNYIASSLDKLETMKKALMQEYFG